MTMKTPEEIAREIAICTCTNRPEHCVANDKHFANCPTELVEDIAAALRAYGNERGARHMTDSPLLIEAVRAGCLAAAQEPIGTKQTRCDYPNCADCNAHVAIEAALAHVLKAEPSEAILKLLRCSPEVGKLEERDYYVHWYKLLNKILLKELGLEKEND